MPALSLLSSKHSIVLLAAEAVVGLMTPEAARTVRPRFPLRQPDKTYVIAFLQSDSKDPWHMQLEKDLKAAAEKFAEIKLVAHDCARDPLKQAEHIKQLASEKINLIILTPVDASIIPKLTLASDANVPIIVLDTPIDSPSVTTYIGVDNRLLGREAGKWIARKLNNKGHVVELKGSSEDEAGRALSEPFRDALKGTEIKIVYDGDTQWSKDKAREHMQQALSANPDPGSINLVFTATDAAAIAAYEVSRDAKRDEDMLFVTIGALPEVGLKAVKTGEIDAAFDRTNGASAAIDAALLILAGKPVPATITLGTRLYTPENIEKGGEEIKPGTR